MFYVTLGWTLEPLAPYGTMHVYELEPVMFAQIVYGHNPIWTSSHFRVGCTCGMVMSLSAGHMGEVWDVWEKIKGDLK